MTIDNLPLIDFQPTDDVRSLYDQFKDVIGLVDGLPPDLSENPAKYMLGFGETRDIETPASYSS